MVATSSLDYAPLILSSSSLRLSAVYCPSAVHLFASLIVILGLFYSVSYFLIAPATMSFFANFALSSSKIALKIHSVSAVDA